jgi:hypothetical protein
MSEGASGPRRRRSSEEQLRRFMGVKAGRKNRPESLLVDALDLNQVPRPLKVARLALPTFTVD